MHVNCSAATVTFGTSGGLQTVSLCCCGTPSRRYGSVCFAGAGLLLCGEHDSESKMKHAPFAPMARIGNKLEKHLFVSGKGNNDEIADGAPQKEI